MSLSKIGALIVADRAQAIAEITKAVIDAGGKREAAAELLGSDVRTLYRWIERLDLWEKLDLEAEKHGFPVLPGAPRTKIKLIGALVEARGSMKRAAAALGRSEASLKQRIAELDLYDDLNRTLEAAGLAPIPKPEARAS